MRAYFATASVGRLTRTEYSSVRIDEFDGTWARARGIYLITQQSAESDDPVPIITGVVEWEFERIAEGWRFRRQSAYNDQRRWYDREPDRDEQQPAGIVQLPKR
tara:strand:+ start:176 stop:487 length:312 start_codon:yes stop_codon:yes gene_type:complete